MDGQIFAPAKSAFPPSLAVIYRKEPWTVVWLCPGKGGMPQGAMDGYVHRCTTGRKK